MQSSKEAFLALVRLGIGHTAGILPNIFNWDEIQALADAQGLCAVVIDGTEKLPENQRPPKTFLLQWIGEVLQGYEFRYELYRRTIGEMAAFYHEHGFKMMVLKGFACSLNWQKPEHRPCGDIDIWQFGQQKEADAILARVKGINVDKSHHHHTVFKWGDFTVENHYDFNNIHHHKSSAELEKIFKELGKDNSHSVEIFGEMVYLPSPNLHALFLLKHSMTDFAAFYVTLRQVLDWAFFVKAHGKEVDWEWLSRVMEQYHMLDFFNTINAICVEDLGFEVNIFPNLRFSNSLKDKVLADILAPKFTRRTPKRLIPRLLYKFRRWKGNAWKHDMCYNESLWSAFWTGVWNHITKPASI